MRLWSGERAAVSEGIRRQRVGGVSDRDSRSASVGGRGVIRRLPDIQAYIAGEHERTVGEQRLAKRQPRQGTQRCSKARWMRHARPLTRTSRETNGATPPGCGLELTLIAFN